MARWLPGSLKEGLSWVITSQFVIAISALCLSLETYLLLDIPLGARPVLGFVFFGSLAVYNLAFLGRNPFEIGAHGNKKTVLFLFVLSLLCSMAFMCFLTAQTILLAVISGMAGMLYLYRIKWPGGFIQVRNIPLVKNILLALIWSLVTVLIPVSAVETTLHFPPDTMLVFLRRFFFILAIAIPYDIRDYNIDVRNRLNTLPVAAGIGKTKMVAMASLLVFVMLIFYDPIHPQTHVSSSQVSLALTLSAIFTGVIILMSGVERKKIYFSLLLDGSMTLQFIILFTILNMGSLNA